MTALYEVVQTYHAELAALQEADLPAEVVHDTLEAIQWPVEEKVRAVVAFALQLKADAEIRAEHAKRMADSAKTMKNRADALMTYVTSGLLNSGLKLPLVCPEFTVNVAKNPPSLEVVDESAIPFQFRRRSFSFEIPEDWTDAQVEDLASKMDVPVRYEETVDRKALLDAVKKDPAAHEAYARIAPTAYRLTVR
jgi:hypothetical protein